MLRSIGYQRPQLPHTSRPVTTSNAWPRSGGAAGAASDARRDVSGVARIEPGTGPTPGPAETRVPSGKSPAGIGDGTSVAVTGTSGSKQTGQAR